MASTTKTYVVEHLDEELGPWSELEYIAVAKESYEAGLKFCLSSLPQTLLLPMALKSIPGFVAENHSVEELYSDNKSRVCLLDPAAAKELSPEDGERFDIFLFGGILGELVPYSQSKAITSYVGVFIITYHLYSRQAIIPQEVCAFQVYIGPISECQVR
jgi:ribosome biogenesis SPOUT family RNA methylase Rps3